MSTFKIDYISNSWAILTDEQMLKDMQALDHKPVDMSKINNGLTISLCAKEADALRKDLSKGIEE